MIILGIDPGTTSIGYALLECGPQLRVLEADLVKITSDSNQGRLQELHHGISKLIKQWKPDYAAIERLFFSKNAKTAFLVSEARGAILLTTALAGIRVYEYTPLEIKKAVTGDGGADKAQIKKMLVLTMPQLTSLRAQDDVFDAIAVALTCNYTYRDPRQKRA